MNHSQSLQAKYERTFKKNQELEGLVATLAKEARAALLLTNSWQQEFHNNEILGIIAMYTATKKVVHQKESALSIAIEFIGNLELDTVHSAAAIKALELINFAIAGETLEQSIIKQEGN